ncbi:MAG: hypothetical protein ABEK50_08000 [bacterium]
MAFQPIDIQVNVMQSSNVSSIVAHEQDAPQRAQSDQLDKWIEERHEEENTSEEAGEEPENETVDEDQGSNNSFLSSEEEQSESPEDDGNDLNSEASPSEPDKGTYMDLKT